jgi:hypothetical protein
VIVKSSKKEKVFLNKQVWNWVFRDIGLVLALIWLSQAAAFAQDAVPGEILQRTFLIKVGNQTATAFAIDHKGHLYLVTAKHLVAALPTGKTTLELWHSDN